MYKQPISCASIIDQTTNPFVIYHKQLGCFRSDYHKHVWGQLVYAEFGCIHIQTERKRIMLPGWYGAWIPPGTLHEIWSESSLLYMRAMSFPVEQTHRILTNQVAIFPVSGLLREMIRYTEKWDDGSQQGPHVETFLQVLQDILPAEIANAIPICLPSTNHEKLAQVLAYIQLNLHEKISIEFLAKRFGFSVRTLTRLFAKELSVSYASYSKIARIVRALELIETGADNVSQLAHLVGYESLSTFSNNFLQICGNRPLQFIQTKGR